ncbi:MAG: hypothetical protein KOO63_03670 [Bacteroidales bacterium]|nr:hypothetical protein [Candidatus Latescibacterota bacterium]
MKSALVEPFMGTSPATGSKAYSEESQQSVFPSRAFGCSDTSALIGGCLLSQEIVKTYLDAFTEGWDGYGAEPVTRETVAHAIAFASTIPSSFPMPDICADPDGDINFEWYDSPGRVFSISINAAGLLNYAGLFGKSSSYGVEEFAGLFPRAFIILIQRLYSNV